MTGIQDSRIGKRNEWFKTLVLQNYDCPLGQYFGLPVPVGMLRSWPDGAIALELETSTLALTLVSLRVVNQPLNPVRRNDRNA